MASTTKSDEKEAWKRVVALRIKESELLGITNAILHEFRNEEIIGDLNLDTENGNDMTEDDIFIRKYLFEQLLMFHINIMTGCTETAPSTKARRASWNSMQAIIRKIDEEKQKKLPIASSGARFAVSSTDQTISEKPTVNAVDVPAPAASFVEAEQSDQSTDVERAVVVPSRRSPRRVQADASANGSSSHFVPLVPIDRPNAPPDGLEDTDDSSNDNDCAVDMVPPSPRTSKRPSLALELQKNSMQDSQLIQRKVRRNGASHSLLETYDLSSVPEKPEPEKKSRRVEIEAQKKIDKASLSHDVPSRRSRDESGWSRNVSDAEPRKRHRSGVSTFDHYTSHDSRNEQWQSSGVYGEKRLGSSGDPPSHVPLSRSFDGSYKGNEGHSMRNESSEQRGKDFSEHQYQADKSYRGNDRSTNEHRYQKSTANENGARESGFTDYPEKNRPSLEQGLVTEFSPIRKKGQSKNITEKSVTGGEVSSNTNCNDVLREKVVMDSFQFLKKTASDSLPSSKWTCQLCDCEVKYKNLPRHCNTAKHSHLRRMRLKETSRTCKNGPPRTVALLPNSTLESENVGAMPPASRTSNHQTLCTGNQDASTTHNLVKIPIDKFACSIWADVKELNPTRDKRTIVFDVMADLNSKDNFTSSHVPRTFPCNVTIRPAAVTYDESQALGNRLQEWDPFWVIKSIVFAGCTQPIYKVNPETPLIRTAAQHYFVKDLREKYRDLKTTDGNWSNGDRVLLLRMLPEAKVASKAKRADCHIWPKGTFLQITGTACRIVQRKQQGHNEKEWSYQSKEFNASSILTKTSGRGLMNITCADEEKYYYILTLCEYQDPIHVFNVTWEKMNRNIFPSCFRKARTFASQQMSISLEDDSDANGVDETGKFIFTLTCPLSRKIMETPVRGKTCKHFQCFDLMCFINTNQYVSGSRWRCPSCELFVSLQNLEFCALTARLLKEFESSLSADRDRIEFSSSGSYKLLESQVDHNAKIQRRTDAMSETGKKDKDIVIVDIDDD